MQKRRFVLATLLCVGLLVAVALEKHPRWFLPRDLRTLSEHVSWERLLFVGGMSVEFWGFAVACDGDLVVKVKRLRCDVALRLPLAVFVTVDEPEVRLVAYDALLRDTNWRRLRDKFFPDDKSAASSSWIRYSGVRLLGNATAAVEPWLGGRDAEISLRFSARDLDPVARQVADAVRDRGALSLENVTAIVKADVEARLVDALKNFAMTQPQRRRSLFNRRLHVGDVTVDSFADAKVAADRLIKSKLTTALNSAANFLLPRPYDGSLVDERDLDDLATLLQHYGRQAIRRQTPGSKVDEPPVPSDDQISGQEEGEKKEKETEATEDVGAARDEKR